MQDCQDFNEQAHKLAVRDVPNHFDANMKARQIRVEKLLKEKQ